VGLRVELARLPARSGVEQGELDLGTTIERLVDGGASLCFVLPVALGVNLWQRTLLGEELGAARRRHAGVSIHHDTVDCAHPLLVECFAGQILRRLEDLGVEPRRAGILLVADGQGDPATRADSYRLMRLLWEQCGLGRGEVGFVRHVQPFLPEALGRCLADRLAWVLLPQCQWEGELCGYARVILDDHGRAHPEAEGWRLVDPPGDHPAIRAWLEERLTRLWKEKRAREAARLPSARRAAQGMPGGVWSGADWMPAEGAALNPNAGIVARTRDADGLRGVLSRVLPAAERYLVKVTWHGYATGTYTGPAALEMLLSALPGRAVVLEGHTSSRNLGGADFDWESEAERHRAWVRQQEAEYLRRTGLAEVMCRHGAQYVNVTEAWWDGACAAVEEVRAALGDVEPRFPELAEYVPSVLMELRGAPLISFARFKGPTRLSLSNLFGLIPHPFRAAWHGPDIQHFASVCCDVALIYGSLFRLFGMVEGFDSAVRWDRKGLYRSRWGNYDLVSTDGLLTIGEGVVAADVLASRLQGKDVMRSGFYDVVRERLGATRPATEMALPGDLIASLV
jgi:hypothetical protein